MRSHRDDTVGFDATEDSAGVSGAVLDIEGMCSQRNRGDTVQNAVRLRARGLVPTSIAIVCAIVALSSGWGHSKFMLTSEAYPEHASSTTQS